VTPSRWTASTVNEGFSRFLLPPSLPPLFPIHSIAPSILLAVLLLLPMTTTTLPSTLPTLRKPRCLRPAPTSSLRSPPYPLQSAVPPIRLFLTMIVGLSSGTRSFPIPQRRLSLPTPPFLLTRSRLLSPRPQTLPADTPSYRTTDACACGATTLMDCPRQRLCGLARTLHSTKTARRGSYSSPRNESRFYQKVHPGRC
jgi:hypothetical protein